MQQSLSSGDADFAGLEGMLDAPINRSCTPAAIAAAYDRQIKDKAMKGLLEEREGIDGLSIGTIIVLLSGKYCSYLNGSFVLTLK